MVKIYLCKLTLHDNVFFASRELGTLYETEKYLHNWALSYAFFKGTLIPHIYGLAGKPAQKPGYFDAQNEQNLLHLNAAQIYLFPGLPLQWIYQVNTFKAAQATYYGRAKQFGDRGADRNYPINFGRAKELAVGSTFRTFVIMNEERELPRWIRLGKWAAKIRVDTIEVPAAAITSQSGSYLCEQPLNPLDLTAEQTLQLYNRVVMPPTSLVSQAQLTGDYWQLGHSQSDNPAAQAWSQMRQTDPYLPKTLNLPQGCHYGAEVLNVA
ncbi:MAG: type I-D CRISPR-associated protein Cas5/Csc1 [Spirulinaceae cyanobacterium]